MSGSATCCNCIINTQARTYWLEQFLECHISNANIMLIEVKTPESTAGNIMPRFSLRRFAFPSHCCQHLRHRTLPLYLRYLTSEANTELYCLDFQHNCSAVRGVWKERGQRLEESVAHPILSAGERELKPRGGSLLFCCPEQYRQRDCWGKTCLWERWRILSISFKDQMKAKLHVCGLIHAY